LSFFKKFSVMNNWIINLLTDFCTYFNIIF
jgi:hypothetical protein